MSERSDDKEPSESSPAWARWFTTLTVVVATGLIVFTVWRVGVHTIFAQMKSIGWGFLAVGCIEVAITFCDAAAIYSTIREHRRHPTYGQVLMAQVAGRAVNTVTPLGSLGEATKATILMRYASSTAAVSSIVFYNLATTGVALSAIAVGAPLCALWLSVPSWMSAVLIIGGVVAGTLVIGVALLLRRGLLSTLGKWVVGTRVVPKRWVGKIRKQVKELDEQLQRGDEKQNKAHRRAIFWAATSRALSWGESWVILASVGTIVGPGVIAALASAGVLIGWASAVVPLGLGVTEGGNAALFAALRYDPALGVTLALTRRLVLLVYAAIGIGLITTQNTVNSAHQLSRKRKQAKAGKKSNLNAADREPAKQPSK